MKKLHFNCLTAFYFTGICSVLLMLSYLFNFNEFRSLFQDKVEVFFFFFWSIYIPLMVIAIPEVYLDWVSYFRRLHQQNKKDYDEHIHEEPYLFDAVKVINYPKKVLKSLQNHFHFKH